MNLFITGLSIGLFSNLLFIHAVKQASNWWTHTSLIQWLTLQWVDQYSLTWHHYKCLGTMLVQLILSKVPSLDSNSSQLFFMLYLNDIFKEKQEEIKSIQRKQPDNFALQKWSIPLELFRSSKLFITSLFFHWCDWTAQGSGLVFNGNYMYVVFVCCCFWCWLSLSHTWTTLWTSRG